MKIYKSAIELIGNTPLVELGRIMEADNLEARLLAKVEKNNPGGSAKDRIALAMIEDAERRGVIKAGATIIEPTSGNTGVGLAWVAALKGYRLILTMPDNMSVERRKLVAALGAEVVLTPAADGMTGSIKKAEEIHEKSPNSFIAQQFSNPANCVAHEQTTAEEIWRDTDGEVDFFVAGVGTGGTLTGTARGLKKHKPSVKAIGVEPENSQVLAGKAAGKHNLQGIGANFIPENYDATVCDEVIPITDEEAYEYGRRLAKEEGLLVGITSGASLAAAVKLAKRPENRGKTIVVLLPDTGERYLSTELF